MQNAVHFIWARARSLQNLGLILAQRLWQAISGLITVVLIARCLSLDEQGWFYSFTSLAAVSSLFDLGLSVVLVQAAAHQSVRWKRASSPCGPSGECLDALSAWSIRYYILLAFAYLTFVTPIGWLMFAGPASGASAHWRVAWSALVFCAAASLIPVPFLALLEGRGDIKTAYWVRLVQTVLGGIGTWLAIGFGGGIWGTAMAPAAAFLVPAAWIASRERALVRRAFSWPKLPDSHWRREIWPLQWKVGLSLVAGYALTQIVSLMLFKLRGPGSAGQMGLSLTVGNMTGLLAMSWLTRHVPRMAQAAAERDWVTMNTLFKADFACSSIAFIAGAAGLCGLHVALQHTSYGDRLLPFGSFACLQVALFLIHVNGCFAIYLRSFRQEPLIGVALLTAVMNVIGCLATAGEFGAAGVVAVLLATQLLFAFPISLIIWRKRSLEFCC